MFWPRRFSLSRGRKQHSCVPRNLEPEHLPEHPMTEFETPPLNTTPTEALAPGSTLLGGQFTIQSYLSSGGFGITYLATDSLNRTVVIKECYPEAFCARVNKTVRARTQSYENDFQSIVQLFVREARSLAKLNHSSVVGVHQVFEDNETAYMALDLIEGQDLLDIIEEEPGRFSPDEIYAMTLDLLDAVGHVHSQDLLHRDISPDNILVEDTGRPVLIDFGAAREEASRKSRVLSSVLVVKDGYSPQEFYLAGSQQFPSSDLYALGATLSHLISGEAPPNSQARLAALAANQPDLYTPLCGRFPQYDDAFLAAIDKAMNIVPANRIQSAKEWSVMIDPARRAKMALDRAQDDEVIQEKITQLVATVNKGLHGGSAQKARRKAPMPDTSPSEPEQIKQRPPVEVIPSAAEIQAEIEEWKRKHPEEYAQAIHNGAGGGLPHSTSAKGEVVDPVFEKPANKSEEPLRVGRLASIPAVMFASFLLGQMALAEAGQRVNAAPSPSSTTQNYEKAR